MTDYTGTGRKDREMERADDPWPRAEPECKVDMINSPPHYQTEAGIEAIDIIEMLGFNYHIGNAFKYLARADKKTADGLNDLLKAKWYLDREIAQRTKIKA